MRVPRVNEYARFPHYLLARILGKAAPTKRGRIIAAGLWAEKHSSSWSYTETAARDRFLSQPKFQLPKDTDCSGFVTWCYWKIAPDPNGLDYKQLGYTGSLLSHAHTITEPGKAKAGDPIVVGPGNGDHVYLCLRPGRNPLCLTHGTPGVHRARIDSDPRVPYRVCVTL